MSSKVVVLGVEMSSDEAKALVRVITDPSFVSSYIPFLRRLYAINEKKILRHDPENNGIHAEGVLRGRNLQILDEVEKVREIVKLEVPQS